VEVWQTSNLRLLRLGEEKKERRKKKPRGKYIMVCPIPQGDHNKLYVDQSALTYAIQSYTDHGYGEFDELKTFPAIINHY